MDGIYAMYFTGAVGSGMTLFVMKNGIVTGADAVGGELDGTYEIAADGSLGVDVVLSSPPGTTLVTGAASGQEPMRQEIKTRLPPNFADGAAVGVQTPTGPVNVVFRRLRDVP